MHGVFGGWGSWGSWGASIPLAILKGLAVLAKYGIEAHLFIPGVGKVNGIDAQNFLESTFVTPSTVNTPVGGVKNASGGTINLTQDTTANKPLLGIEPMGGRKNVLQHSETFNVSPWNGTTTHTYTSVPTTAPVKLTKITVTSAAIATQAVTAAATSCVVSWIVRGASSTNTLLLRNSTTATNLTGCSIYTNHTQSTGANITVEQLGDNVRRISITYTTGFSVGDLLVVYLGTDTGVGDWTEFGGVQLSWGTTISPYQRTLSAYEAYEDGKDSIYYWQKGASSAWLSGAPLFDGTVRDYYVGVAFTPNVLDSNIRYVFSPAMASGLAMRPVIYASSMNFRIFDSDGTNHLDASVGVLAADTTYVMSGLRLGNTVYPKLNGVVRTAVTKTGQSGITPTQSRIMSDASGTTYPSNGKLCATCAVQASITADEQTTLDTMLDYISGRVR